MNIKRMVRTTKTWVEFINEVVACANLKYGMDWHIIEHNGYLNVSIAVIDCEALVSIESPALSTLTSEERNLVASSMYVSKVPITYVASLMSISRQVIYKYINNGVE